MISRRSQSRFGERQCGFSLVEVLIALVILSVGLLGVAALQTASLRTNSSAYIRTQATAMAYSILDRMRANPDGARAGDYSVAFGSYSSIQACNAGTSCSPAQMADYDLNAWKQQLATELPQGDGSITTTATGNLTQITVTIKFDDSRGQGPLTQFTVSTAI